MLSRRFAAVMVMTGALLLQTGCSLIGSGAGRDVIGRAGKADEGDAARAIEPSSSRRPGWVDAFARQYRQAVEGIRSDLAVLDSDDDGLDQFGPVAAREMRSARAEMALPAR